MRLSSQSSFQLCVSCELRSLPHHPTLLACSSELQHTVQSTRKLRSNDLLKHSAHVVVTSQHRLPNALSPPLEMTMSMVAKVVHMYTSVVVQPVQQTVFALLADIQEDLQQPHVNLSG